MASMLTYDGYSSEEGRDRLLSMEPEARIVRMVWSCWVAACTDVIQWGSEGNGRRGADRGGRFSGYPVYHWQGRVVQALPATIA